ncbi:hypothetical protein [Caldimonas sp. KR1-144]|uniref:hypothetical protein n=1 Tax=Caldimonas sp. KR1-144 TaxID=3400911 RepID=UPI003C0D2D38
MNTPVPTVRRRPTWPAVLAILAVLTLVGVGFIGWTLHSVADTPISVVVDGVEQWPPLSLAQMPPAHKVVLVVGVALAIAIVLLVVPFALLLGLGAALIGIVFGVGLPLLAVLAVLALVLSPFLLLGWGLWRLLRPARNAAPTVETAATTMQA